MAEKVDENQSINEEQYLETNFGVKTLDEAKTLVEKGKNPAGNEEIVTELKQYKEKFTELETSFGTTQAELTALKNAPPTVQPYKHEISKFTDSLVDKGLNSEQIVEALKWSGVDLDKMPVEDKIKLAYKLQNPGWNDNHANANFIKNFGVEADADDNEKTLKEAELLQAANKSNEFLKDFIGKKFEVTPDATKEQRNAALIAQKKELESHWSAKTPSIVKDLGKLERTAILKLPGTTGKVEDIEVKYSYQIPDNDLSELSTNMTKTAVSNLYPSTQEGEQELIKLGTNVVTAKYADKLLDNQLLATTNAFMSWLKTNFNVEIAPGAGGQAGNQGEVKDTYESRVMANEKKNRTRR